MAEEIRVRIIPGCPTVVVAETEEEREKAELALADVECGCQVITEEALEEASARVEEAQEATSEVAQETTEEAEEKPVCSLEPDKPWDESVCGVVAKQAAEDVLRRLREKGVIG